MKAVIELDVPEWQIGQPVSVYFPDTMQKKGTCELLKEQEKQRFFVDEDGKITPLPVVVRCKDCIHVKWADVDDETVFCKLQEMGHNWDFFCADGKRKET